MQPGTTQTYVKNTGKNGNKKIGKKGGIMFGKGGGGGGKEPDDHCGMGGKEGTIHPVRVATVGGGGGEGTPSLFPPEILVLIMSGIFRCNLFFKIVPKYGKITASTH